MFPNLISNSITAWLGLLGVAVALPLLIHLINMLRHRRVRWAAMDFLLQSHQKNRSWIWLKQLLLLLSRMSILIVILLMLAQMGCEPDRETRSRRGQPVHHIVILDDSLSMSESRLGESLFSRARQSIDTIVAAAARQQDQNCSLLRYSQAAFSRLSDEGDPDAQRADFYRAAIDSRFRNQLNGRLQRMSPSDLPAGPAQALMQVLRWREVEPSEQAIVYLISDFRESDWNDASDVTPLLEQLRRSGVSIQMISCARESGQNLAITELRPASGMQVPNVQTFMTMTVTNYSPLPAEQVQVRVRTQTYDERDATRHRAGEWTVDKEELPTVFFDRIEPGESSSQQFPLMFPSAGSHVVQATLQEDALAADNERHCVVSSQPSIDLLVVEDGFAPNAYYWNTALQPLRARTGIAVNQLGYDAFSRLDASELQNFDAIVLFGPQRFRQVAVQLLEQFVEQGGGLIVFLDPTTDLSFVNTSLYREGEGLLPFALEDIAQLEELIDPSAADIVVSEDPLFRVFKNNRNSPLELVNLRQFVRAATDWEQTSTAVDVHAFVRQPSLSPLIAGKRLGYGRTLLVSTCCLPEWTDWASNPSFVVMALQMTEAVVRNRHPSFNQEVGETHTIPLLGNEISQAETGDQLELFGPDGRVEQQRNSDSNAPGKFVLSGDADAKFNELTATAGVYEAWYESSSGRSQVVRWSANLTGAESRLELAGAEALAQRMTTVRPSISSWTELSSELQFDFRQSWLPLLLLIASALLMGEPILSYVSSFHSSKNEVRI